MTGPRPWERRQARKQRGHTPERQQARRRCPRCGAVMVRRIDFNREGRPIVRLWCGCTPEKD